MRKPKTTTTPTATDHWPEYCRPKPAVLPRSIRRRIARAGGILAAFGLASHYFAQGVITVETYAVSQWRSYGQPLVVQGIARAGYRPIDPREHRDPLTLAGEACAAVGLLPALCRAVARVESGGNPLARSSKGAIGVLQVMPATAKAFGYDPERLNGSRVLQAEAGARVLRSEFDAARGDLARSLMRYNGGPRCDHGRCPEAVTYAARVLRELSREVG